MQAAYLRHLFPKVVSYNRLVELEREVTILLTLFIKKVLLGKCTGISFVDSTPLRVCRNQRIHIHKVFKGIAQRGKCSMGWFFGFKLHLICNEKGEILNFMITRETLTTANHWNTIRLWNSCMVSRSGTRDISARTSPKGFSLTEYNLLPN